VALKAVIGGQHEGVENVFVLKAGIHMMKWTKSTPQWKSSSIGHDTVRMFHKYLKCNLNVTLYQFKITPAAV